MNKIKNNLRIISTSGGDFACFFEIEDLYSSLSGLKDPLGENMEFIEIGNIIQLNNQKLKVLNINLTLNNISNRITHLEKNDNNFPKNICIETVITVEVDE